MDFNLSPAEADCLGHCVVPFVRSLLQHQIDFNMSKYILYFSGACRGLIGWEPSGWMNACIVCWAAHTPCFTHTATYSFSSLLCFSWTPCCVRTKQLSALGLTLKHHIMLTLFYFSSLLPSQAQWKSLSAPTLMRTGDLWPLILSALPVNVSFKCADGKSPHLWSFMGKQSERSTKFVKWLVSCSVLWDSGGSWAALSFLMVLEEF